MNPLLPSLSDPRPLEGIADPPRCLFSGTMVDGYGNALPSFFIFFQLDYTQGNSDQTSVGLSVTSSPFCIQTDSDGNFSVYLYTVAQISGRYRISAYDFMSLIATIPDQDTLTFADLILLPTTQSLL